MTEETLEKVVVTDADKAKLAAVAAERASREAKAEAKGGEAKDAKIAAEKPVFVGPRGGIPTVDVNPGRSKFSGKVIVRLVAGNPRRPTSHGARAFGYYAKEVGGSVAYETYRIGVERDPKIKGGLNHLAYDIAKGFVRVEDPSAVKTTKPAK